MRALERIIKKIIDNGGEIGNINFNGYGNPLKSYYCYCYDDSQTVDVVELSITIDPETEKVTGWITCNNTILWEGDSEEVEEILRYL